MPNVPAPNQTVSEYDLRSLMDLMRREIMLAISCHHVGTIQTFDPVKQRADVSINYKRVNFGKQGDPPAVIPYPPLIDCPVVVMHGGDGALTFPIEVGDNCIVLFNDRDINDWYAGGQVGPPPSSRLHSFADAMVLVGINSLATPIADYVVDKVVLKKGTTALKIGEKFSLSNDDTDLKTLLVNIVGAIQSLATAITPGTGISIPALAAQIASLTALSSTMGDLLE